MQDDDTAKVRAKLVEKSPLSDSIFAEDVTIREVNLKTTQRPNTVASLNVAKQTLYNISHGNYGNTSNSNAQLPKVSFREATESVSSFEGYNIPLAQFTRACPRAREIVSPSSERNLTKLLINKLRGKAYYAVEDEPCDSMTQMMDLLNGAFGSPKTIDQYRGELSTIYL